jgi:outer membrane protein TolC
MYRKTACLMMTLMLVLMGLLFSFTVYGSEVIRLTMDEAIKYALENNASFRILTKQQELSDKKIGLPEFNLSISTTPRIDTRVYGGLHTGTGITAGTDIHLHGQQTVMGGDLTADLRVSPDLVDSTFVTSMLDIAYTRNLIGSNAVDTGNDSQKTLDSARDKLVGDIINAYISAVKKQQQIVLSEFDVAIKRMTVMALQTRKESDEEIEKAQEQLQIAVTNHIAAVDSYNEALSVLKGYLGMSENVLIEVCDDMVPPEVSGDLQKWLDLAMTGNQSIITASDSLNRSKEKLSELEAGPGWNADLSTGLSAPDLSSPIQPNFYIQISARKVLDLTPKTEIEEAKVAVEAAELDFLNTKNSVIKQVENAYKKFVDTLKQIEDLRLQLNKVNDDLTINEKKYEVGFISSLDLLKAQYSVERIKNDVFSTICDAVLADFELKKLCGVRW